MISPCAGEVVPPRLDEDDDGNRLYSYTSDNEYEPYKYSTPPELYMTNPAQSLPGGCSNLEPKCARCPLARYGLSSLRYCLKVYKRASLWRLGTLGVETADGLILS